MCPCFLQHLGLHLDFSGFVALWSVSENQFRCVPGWVGMHLQSLHLSSDLNPCVNRSVGGQFQPDQWLREPQKVSYCSSSMCWVPLGLSLACLCLPFVSARFSFSPSPPLTPNQSHYLPRHRREVSQSEATNRLRPEDRPRPGTARHRRGQVSSDSPFQGATGPASVVW